MSDTGFALTWLFTAVLERAIHAHNLGGVNTPLKLPVCLTNKMVIITGKSFAVCVALSVKSWSTIHQSAISVHGINYRYGIVGAVMTLDFINYTIIALVHWTVVLSGAFGATFDL
jgi:uncharacterized protein YunC (DUF1805 family)